MSRTTRVTVDGWEYEAGQRHVERVIRTVKMDSGEPVSIPGEDDEPRLQEEEKKELDRATATEYQALAATAKNLGQGGPGAQYAFEEVRRGRSLL